MNISDFNPLGGEKVNGNRNVSSRSKPESRENAEAPGAERAETRAKGMEEPRETSPARDVFQTSEDRRKISDLTDQVQRAEEPPRQELVNRARERAASGYYNSSEFLGNLALRLINSESIR